MRLEHRCVSHRTGRGRCSWPWEVCLRVEWRVERAGAGGALASKAVPPTAPDAYGELPLMSGRKEGSQRGGCGRASPDPSSLSSHGVTLSKPGLPRAPQQRECGPGACEAREDKQVMSRCTQTLRPAHPLLTHTQETSSTGRPWGAQSSDPPAPCFCPKRESLHLQEPLSTWFWRDCACGTQPRS